MRGTDFNHKASTAMAKRYDTVVIEDLNIRGLQGNHHLAKGITDQGWHRFTDMLEYRLKWKGEELIRMGRFEPSSGLCSICGNIKHDLKLSGRIYHCDACGLVIDRDYNASKNIRRMGLIKVGPERPEFAPVEIATSGLRGLCPYGRMSAFEAGASDASAEEQLTTRSIPGAL